MTSSDSGWPWSTGRLLLLLPILCLLGCDGGVVIEVRVSGRPVEAKTLLVSARLDDAKAVELGQSVTAPRSTFRVQIRDAYSGRLALHVSAQDATACENAVGDGVVDLRGSGTYGLDIELSPQTGCRLEVELVGSVPGQVTSDPAGIACGFACGQRFKRNELVLLRSETPEQFGGWFTDDSQPACVGRLGCTITISSSVTRVRANFLHAASCTPSGWCSEEDLPAELGSNTLYAVWGSGRDDVWAVGDYGTILRGDGLSWKPVPAPLGKSLRAVWGSGPSDVYSVGETGTMLHFDGTGWSALPARTLVWLNGIWGTGRDNVWVVGDRGTILLWDGGTWSAVASGTTQSLRAIWGSGRQDVWAVGDAGTILHFGGKEWEPLYQGTTSNSLYALWGTGANNLWMVGDAGVILHFAGAGTPLTQTKVAGVTGLHAIWGVDTQRQWVAGDRGVILVSSNNMSWLPVGSLPTGKQLTGLWGGGPFDVWAVGQDLTLIRHRP